MVQTFIVSLGLIALATPAAGASVYSEPPSRTIRVDEKHAGFLWLSSQGLLAKDTSKILIAWPNRGRFVIRDLAAGTIEEHVMTRRSGTLSLQAISRDHKTLLFRDRRGRSVLYSVPARRYVTLQGERQQISAMFPLRNDRVLTIDSNHGKSRVVLWKTSNGEPDRTIDLGEGDVTSMAVSTDGDTVFVARSGEIQEWSFHFQKLRQRIIWDGSRPKLWLSPTSQFLSVTNEDGRVVVYDVLNPLRSPKIFEDGNSRVIQMAFEADQLRLVGDEAMVVVTEDGWVRSTNLYRNELTREFRGDDLDRARDVKLSRAGTRLAATLRDGRIRVWFLR